MTSTIEHYQELATSKMKQHSKNICKKYTFGWGSPIDWAKEMFPYIINSIKDIEKKIPNDLPICVFQGRDLQPSDMITVIPYLSLNGNPTNTRVLPSSNISPNTLEMVTEFSQAFLFLLNTGKLPSPMDKEELTKVLISLTDRRLIMA